jgi:hypothetical protein
MKNTAEYSFCFSLYCTWYAAGGLRPASRRSYIYQSWQLAKTTGKPEEKKKEKKKSHQDFACETPPH